MRLDKYLHQIGGFQSREKAAYAIVNEQVKVNGVLCIKPSKSIENTDKVEILNTRKIFVSRSGEKLKSAIEHFKINPQDLVCLDVGSSTGGFTEYLLSKNAKTIFAVDVGDNQMDESIAKNPKVKLFENTDIRNFKSKNKYDLIVVDVSFISLQKIIPALIELSNHKTKFLILFKPQFEVGKEHLKKGICRHPNVKEIIEEFAIFCKKHQLTVKGRMEVPLKGKMGNQEYFLSICYTQAAS